jgi:hypothetical protein
MHFRLRFAQKPVERVREKERPPILSDNDS